MPDKMDVTLDGYLGNIVWYNITDNNIHQYIDKNKDNEGNFLQTLALVTNLAVNEINYIFAKELLHNYGFPSDDIYNIYIKCEDLFGILLQVPGRGNIARLYMYGEQIIKYLNGNMLLLNRINKKTEVEDEDVFHLIRKKPQNNTDHMKLMEKSLSIAQIVDEFESSLQNCKFQDKFFDELRFFFYTNCKKYLCSSECDIYNISHIMTERKRRITQDKDIYDNKRSKSNETSWTQIVKEKNYPIDSQKLRLCGTFGKRYKKHMCYDTTDNKYYYERDASMMKKIVDYVYNGGDNPLICLS